MDDAHAPLRVRKERYLEAIYSLGDGVKPSNALKMARELEAGDL